MSKYIPKTKNSPAPAGRKSVKMEADELTEKIKACVKEALEEQSEAKAEGEGEEGDPTVEAAPTDISALIEQAMDVVAQKRKARKDAGEELGDVSADEVLEAVGEIMEAQEEAKADDGVEDEEAKEDEGMEENEAKGRKAAARPTSTKSAPGRKAAPAPVQRKYSGIYMSRGAGAPSSKKSVPPAI